MRIFDGGKDLDVLKDIEMDLINVVVEMECTGIGFDVSHLKKFTKLFQDKINWIEKEASRHNGGQEVKMGDSLLLSKILFGNLRLQPIDTKKGKKGAYSTKEEHLKQIDHEFARQIVEYRRLQRTLAIFLPPKTDDSPKKAKLSSNFHVYVHNDPNGFPKIYPNSEQIGSSTGRFSYSSPSLQTIIHDFSFVPCNSDQPVLFSLRRAFVATPGSRLLSADYRQIEIRLIAHFAADKNLSKLLENPKEDIFQNVAKEIFSMKDVKEDQREIAKQICYGICYGLGSTSLAAKLNKTPTEAEDFIRWFKAKFQK